MNEEFFKKRKPDQGLDNLEKHAQHSVWMIGILALFMLFTYFVNFSGYGFSEKQEDWGALGDYIGGILNPLISLAALYWLTRSIILQKRELQETREALRDTADSQSQQVRSSEVSSQLQFISIELGMIASKLSFEYEYQVLLLKFLNESEHQPFQIKDRDGRTRAPEDVLKEINQNIQRLTSSREHMLNAARHVDQGLTAFIEAAKHC